MKEEQKLQFAFAVSDSEEFEAKHFGDADIYLIYQWSGTDMAFVKRLENPMKSYDESYGSKTKGKAIADFLQSHGVEVIVSKRFGKNIQIVNQSFLPVIIDESNKTACFDTLKAYMTMLIETVHRDKRPFPVYALRGGALKIITVNN